MVAFERQRFEVNGCETVVLAAGARSAPVLLYLHGELDTVAGFDFSLPWAERFRLVVPFHPGFGESADDPKVGDVHDYVLHYLDVLDRLEIDRFSLVGQSLGGWIAAMLAVEHARRIERLALVAPLGLRVPEHPAVDLFTLRPEELLPAQTEDPGIFPAGAAGEGDVEHRVARYREMTSLARVAWERNHDPRLPRWLHRATTPTLLLWGSRDRIVPPRQADAWAGYLPDARARTFQGRGHLLLQEASEAVAAVAEFLAA